MRSKKSFMFKLGEQMPSCSCTFMLLFLVLSLTLGSFCFSYDLNVIIGKDVPLVWDIVGGAILGGPSLVIAVVCFIVHDIAKVPAPFWKVGEQS